MALFTVCKRSTNNHPLSVQKKLGASNKECMLGGHFFAMISGMKYSKLMTSVYTKRHLDGIRPHGQAPRGGHSAGCFTVALLSLYMVFPTRVRGTGEDVQAGMAKSIAKMSVSDSNLPLGQMKKGDMQASEYPEQCKGGLPATEAAYRWLASEDGPEGTRRGRAARARRLKKVAHKDYQVCASNKRKGQIGRKTLDFEDMGPSTSTGP
eukprot:SM000313S11968  [mRNA]  locus=s313:123481:124727:+ [translate_table: standard]